MGNPRSHRLLLRQYEALQHAHTMLMTCYERFAPFLDAATPLPAEDAQEAWHRFCGEKEHVLGALSKLVAMQKTLSERMLVLHKALKEQESEAAAPKAREKKRLSETDWEILEQAVARRAQQKAQAQD